MQCSIRWIWKYEQLCLTFIEIFHAGWNTLSRDGVTPSQQAVHRSRGPVSTRQLCWWIRMRRGDSFKVYKRTSYIFYNKLFLHQGNLEPGSTYIISLAAHNKLGFSKSARITVTLPQSQLSDTGGEREHVIEVLGPGIVHQRGLFSLNCGGKISIK